MNVSISLTLFSSVSPLERGLLAVAVAMFFLSAVLSTFLSAVIRSDARLHRPVYVLLANLSLCGVLGGAALCPALLRFLLWGRSRLSLVDCLVQIFFTNVYTGGVFCLLALMAFDRYVSICLPLRYHSIVTPPRLRLLLLSLYGFLLAAAAVQVYLTSREALAREVRLRSEVSTEGSEVAADSSTSSSPTDTAPPMPSAPPTTAPATPSAPPTTAPATPSAPPTAPRSRSASSPRILGSLQGLFSKRRGRSLSLEVDLLQPITFSVSTGAPRRAIHVWEDEAVHCVRFSRCAEVFATADDDRRLRVWNIHNGGFSVGSSLFGFTESVTCIDFDQTGFRVLASSYDKSALLWQLDDPQPKLTLTGHRRKVCAARFCSTPPLVVTGSADGSIRLWDLQREACTRVLEAGSHCSDLVCSDSSVISGHFDGRLRLWDLRSSVSCVLELRVPDRVTGLDLSSDCQLLLGCCRDDGLHLFDLRGRSFAHTCLRADGFSCGSDSNKAVISPDRALVAGGSSDGAVYIWNVSSGQVQTRLTDQHSSSLGGVSWSVSGRYFVSVDKRRRAVLWSDI
ncbi:protein Atg16l2-like [Boleophthalmus pectinirostris]|uniref:protein Atg16l2-like n=1 Tax=Boleophthalmus pectinirostris TaxID=150288 RepID=UPI00242BE3FE|nr:protein Atg16l2-like [Boleophthalmus pectinirostris]